MTARMTLTQSLLAKVWISDNQFIYCNHELLLGTVPFAAKHHVSSRLGYLTKF
jgi:hypothetical protein